MRDSFIICNTEFKFNLMDISKVFRFNVNKLDKLVDFDTRLVIKLYKCKNHFKLTDISNKVAGVDIVSYLKSDYAFMNQVMECINILSKNYTPKSLDYHEITECKNDVYYNDSGSKDIVIKWTQDGLWEDDRLLITIF